jgi:Aspartyl protease
MRRLILTTLMLLAALVLPCVAAPAPEQAVSQLPFVMERGHVLVQVKIKGETPVEVILATGAEHSTMDAGLLEKYKLPAYYTGEGVITGGPTDRTYAFTNVPDIRVGDVKITSLSMRFGSLADVSQRVGREIFGVFGADFFKGRVVQFDFAQKVVRFLPKSSTDAIKKDDKTSAVASNRIILPMRSPSEQVTLPLVENVTLNGKKIKTLLDTGTVVVISISASAAKQMGLTGPPEKSPPRAETVNSVRLDEYELTNVPALLFAKGAGFDGAIAGVGLLKAFVLTFDFSKKLVILEPISN